MRSDIGNTGDFYIAVKQVAKGVRTRRDGSSGLRGFALYFELNRRTSINHPGAVIIIFQSNDFGGSFCYRMAVNQVIIFDNILVGGYGNLAGISAGRVALNSAYRVAAGEKVKILWAVRSAIGNTGDFYLAEQILEGVRTRLAGNSAGRRSGVGVPVNIIEVL